MVRRILTVLAILFATTVVAMAAPKPKPFRWNWKDVPGSLRRLQTSKDPIAARIRAEIRNGPTALAKERKLARAWGLPLTTAEWPVKPPATGDDAKPLYDRAFALEAKDKLEWPERVDDLLSQAAQGKKLAPADLEYLHAEVAKRREMLDLLHEGAAKPALSTPPVKPGDSVGTFPFPDMARQRQVARAIKNEAMVLALEGHFAEAARIQVLGYSVAHQMYQHPTLIAYLVGAAIEAITNAGMDFTLHQAGPDASQAVLSALEKVPRDGLLPWAFRGEVWFTSDAFRAARQQGPKVLEEMFETEPDAPAPKVRRLTASERKLYMGLLDAMEADSLRRLRGLIAASEKPFPERIEAMSQIVPDNLDPRDPVSSGAAWSFGTLAASGRQEARRWARHDVLLSGASVLAFHARTGNWPDRLDEALAPPADPFTGKPLSYRKEGGGFVVWSPGAANAFDTRPGGNPLARAEFRYP
jgi:hypothetical protein